MEEITKKYDYLSENTSQNTKESKNQETPLIKHMNTKFFFIFFSLSILNNLSYEIIFCFSNDLAKDFGEEKFMSLFSGSLVLFGIFARIINSKFLLKIRHRRKNLMVIFIFVLGIFIMCVSMHFQIFMFSILATLFFGLASSLGESTNLGFMKGLPIIVASGHSSGAGLSGVLGCVLYLFLKIYNFSFYSIMFSMLLSYPFYGYCFNLVLVLKQKWNYIIYSNNKMMNLNKLKIEFKVNSSSEEKDKTENLELDMEAIEYQESQINQYMSWETIKSVWPKSYSYILGFFCLYFLEYVAISWITSHIIHEYSLNFENQKMPFLVTYGFEISMVFYRVFLFFGRSTLSFFKVKNFWFLIFLLLICDGIYFVHSIFNSMFTFTSIFINMFFIAVFGGIIYCNIIYIALQNNSLKKSEKEITMNLLSMFGDLGILLSSISGIIVSKYFYN
jgi:MFS family permease